jgi:chemotaxis protein methyltransferase CheR
MSVGASVESATSAIIELVRARAGLVFPANRKGDVDDAIRKTMVKAGITNVVEWAGLLHGRTSLLDDLITELTIGETYFFRGHGLFDTVRDRVVPEMRRLRGPEHVLRVWSAGCASGEEPYSLAILFEQMALASQARILATDISPVALARARKGNYGTWSLRGEAARRLIGTHLLPVDGRFQLAARIRHRVIFAPLNLAQDIYPTFATNTWGMDLVLCCNVLIYFDADTVSAVARRFYDSLAVGGFLITGPSDPPLAEHAPFETVTTPAGMIYRKPAAIDGRRSTIAVTSQPFEQPLQDDEFVPRAPALAPPAAVLPSAMVPTDAVAEACEALARGDNARVVELTRGLPDSTMAVAFRLRALANLGDLATAASASADAMARHPSSAEIGFLHAILLMNLDHYTKAEAVLRRVLYLDRSLVVAHFALGATLNQLGKTEEASRAYRNARDLAVQHPADHIVPFSDGERAGQLAKAAAAQVALLETPTGRSP